MTSKIQRSRRWLALVVIYHLQQHAVHCHEQIQPENPSQLRRHTQEDTCIIDGIEFQPGENVGNSFVTRCGPTTEWPCFCAPGNNPPVDCPYCSMVDVDEGLVCSKDGETVSIVNLNDVPQSCTCTISADGTPVEVCTDSDGDDGPDDNDNENNGDVCSIRVADGSIMEFENGESLGDFLPTRCLGGSSEFPCFCNTDLPTQVDCPYCTFLDVNGDLICSRQKESIIYEAEPGELLECACFSDLLSTCKPMAPTLSPVATPPPTTASVTITDSPTITVTKSITDSPTAKETEEPTNENTSPPVPITSAPSTIGPKTESPTESDSILSTIFNKENESFGDRTPPSDPELGGCLYLNETTGLVDFIPEGEPFGPNIHGPCSPSDEWPVLCNPAIPNGGMEYPYCVFETLVATTEASSSSSKRSGNTIVCARTEERVTIALPDGSSEECSCLYFNPLLGPSSSCPMVKVSLSGNEQDVDNSPTPSPTSANELPESPVNDNEDGDNSAAATMDRFHLATIVILMIVQVAVGATML